VRRTFPYASTCPGVTSPHPLDALRTFNLPIFAYAKRSYGLLLPVLARGEEDFSISFSPTLARGEEVFLIYFSPTLARGEEVFLISFSPTPARGEEVFLISFSPTLARGEEVFSISFSPTLARGEEVFSISFSPDGGQKVLYLCLRSLGGDEGLKLHSLKTLFWMHATWIRHCLKLHRGDKVPLRKLKKRRACKLNNWETSINFETFFIG